MFPELKEAEAAIPKWSPTSFTQEKSARNNSVFSALEPMDMMELRGWKPIGWAFSCDVAPRDLCQYVVMFEDENGKQAWCHIAAIILQRMVMQLRQEKSG